MGFYRNAEENIRFPTNYSSAHHDIFVFAILTAGLAIYAGFLMIAPSFKWNKRTLVAYTALTINCFIGFVIYISQFTYAWQFGEITTETIYAPYDNRHIEATIGLHIGLRGFNITLRGHPREQFGQVIDYNEQFLWSDHYNQRAGWEQGIFGFGIYAGAVAQKFRAWQVRGSPYPITDIAEYFTLDGEDIRWGRWYRVGGYYTHICLWLSLFLWVIATIVFFIKPTVGAIWMMTTGVMLEVATLSYGILTEHLPKTELQIPFSAGILNPTLGWSFYLVLVAGILATFLGLTAYIYLFFYPEENTMFSNELWLTQSHDHDDAKLKALLKSTSSPVLASRFKDFTLVIGRGSRVPISAKAVSPLSGESRTSAAHIPAFEDTRTKQTLHMNAVMSTPSTSSIHTAKVSPARMSQQHMSSAEVEERIRTQHLHRRDVEEMQLQERMTVRQQEEEVEEERSSMQIDPETQGELMILPSISKQASHSSHSGMQRMLSMKTELQEARPSDEPMQHMSSMDQHEDGRYSSNGMQVMSSMPDEMYHEQQSSPSSMQRKPSITELHGEFEPSQTGMARMSSMTLDQQHQDMPLATSSMQRMPSATLERDDTYPSPMSSMTSEHQHQEAPGIVLQAASATLVSPMLVEEQSLSIRRSESRVRQVIKKLSVNQPAFE